MEIEQSRKDAWSESDDLILAQTVLAHIKSGSTQLNAFDDVAERLGRTAAACGFRWNATVRKSYDEEIKNAKIVRLSNRGKLKMATVSHHVTEQLETDSEISIDQVISFIKSLQHKIIERDNKIIELEQQLANANKSELSMSEDYKTLLKILDTARNLGNVIP